MKILCIGRNYVEHIHELNNEIPSDPVLFLKPQSALLQQGRAFYIPNFSQEIHYECEVVLRICKTGKEIKPKFASSYFDAFTLGIDFTARDIQEKQKAKGLPWDIAKGFDQSAVLGTWIPFEDENQKMNPIQFSLEKNGFPVQQGDTALMMYSFVDIIVHLSKYFTLQTGDVVFTGTPKGVGPVAISDKLVGKLGDVDIFSLDIK